MYLCIREDTRLPLRGLFVSCVTLIYPLMCLSPITIKNRARYVNATNLAASYTVPCGTCAECQEAKRKEYIFRSYQQFKDTFTRGGFSYFDTLTFSEEHLPHVPGTSIPCFDRKLVSDFMKRFRIYFVRNIDPDIRIKYLQDEEFGGINLRPHIHVMFFFDRQFDPDLVDQALRACWTYGRLDETKTPSQKVVSANLNFVGIDKTFDGPFHGVTGGIEYVSKYVTKDVDFGEIDDLLKVERQRVIDAYDNGLVSSSEKDAILASFKNCYPQHRQSQGFGLGLIVDDSGNIDKNVEKLLFETDQVSFPDKTRVFKTIPLPMYYKRKLWYELKETPSHDKYQKSYHWSLTVRGKNYLRRHFDDRVKRVEQRYRDLLNVGLHLMPSDNITRIIFDLLADRGLNDLALYEVCYRHMIADPDQISRLSPVEFYIQKYNYNHFIDKDFHLSDGVQSSALRAGHIVRYSPDDAVEDAKTDFNIYINTKISFGDLKRIDENFPGFENFDQILNIFDNISKKYDDLKIEYFDWLNAKKSLAKATYSLCKNPNIHLTSLGNKHLTRLRSLSSRSVINPNTFELCA